MSPRKTPAWTNHASKVHRQGLLPEEGGVRLHHLAALHDLPHPLHQSLPGVPVHRGQVDRLVGVLLQVVEVEQVQVVGLPKVLAKSSPGGLS